MKKSILLLLVAVLFMSCEKVQVSSRTLQANLNDSFFRAYSVSAQASNQDQMIAILGRGGNLEKLELYIEWRGEGVYEVGENEVNYATFKSTDGLFYTTNSQGSSGAITVTSQDKVGQEITGEFEFTVITATDTLNVSGGRFYVDFYEITD
ncbi:MAG: hypothetical protein ACI83B_002206 [Sediminicola sp.]|jgi:hypothetical protein|tara:strand:- start:318 stop:770 length:453 start_codon:yes stop_codon:yes gene_type:complete